MASLFGTAIVAICASTPGNYTPACQHAVDAGTRQVGIRQTADSIEDYSVRYATKTYEDNTPRELQSVVGAGAFIYKTAQEKKIRFRAPTMGVADSITNEVTPNSYAISIQWRF